MKKMTLLSLLMTLSSSLVLFAQSLPETKTYAKADRTITVESMDKIKIRVGEVVDVYCDKNEVVNSFWSSSMSACWVDHAYVFHSGGDGNDHPNGQYVAISHIDPAAGLSRLIGLAPTEGNIWMEMYYSISWRYPGSIIYVEQDDYSFLVSVYSVAPKSVTLKEELTLREGDYARLKPSLSPSDAMTQYTWTSDNEAVASVDTDGYVYAHTAGTAIITVETTNGLTARCRVVVTQAPDSISMPEEVIITVGYGYQLAPEFAPYDATADLTWKSSSEDIVKVSRNGYITAVSEGEAEVTVKTDNGLNTTTKVTALAAPEVLGAEKAQERLGVIRRLIGRTL